MINWDPRKDAEYFARRAFEERAMASTCKDNAVAMVHVRLAEGYERRLADQQGPRLAIVA